MKRIYPLVAVGALALVAAGCGTSSSTSSDTKKGAQSLRQYDINQPVPQFSWSQLRQNLIEIQSAQARTTQTTTFFFNLGTPKPIDSCPSIGFPIPVTDQLTNPQQRLTNHEVTVPLIEQTGVYTGDSSGTYAVCLKDNGQAYLNYWEGHVQTVSGPAHWDDGAGQVVMDGASTVKLTTQR